MDNYIGKLLGGRYEIIDVVGVGGMAVVYRARCHVLNRYVAVKILKEEFAKDADIRRRFSIESQAVAKLSHHNIVSVYDVGQDNGTDYIVMELIEGVTLKEYLQKKGHLSWQESLFFAQQIDRALVHAHSRGIIHQDVKPQNVIILRDGTAKLTDFGIASFATTQETRVVQEAIGSVHYISPEQARGSTIDYRTDIYSLGVVMYEMLTGRLPFEGETALQVVMQHLNAVPLLPGEVQQGIPQGMDDIVMHAMCANISKRYATAEALYTDLERLKNNEHAQFSYSCEQEENQTQLLGGEVQQAARRTPIDPARDRAPQRRTAVREPETFFERIGEHPGVAAVVSVVIFAVIALLVVSALLRAGGTDAEKIHVPTLVDKNIDEVLGDAELTAQFNLSEADERQQSPKAIGTILYQSVAPGEEVTKGTSIVLTVSRGSDGSYTVPAFKGKKKDYVTTVLSESGIRHELAEEFSADVEAGLVTRTDPAEGETISTDETVTVYVSRGKEQIDMPALIGRTEAEAKQILTSNGLTFGVSTPVESDEAVGTVIGQSVEAKSKVDKGAIVDLQISAGKTTQPPKPDPEPDDPPTPPDEPEDEPQQPSQPAMGTASIAVALPGTSDTAHVIISVDGEVKHDSTHSTANGTVTIPITASAGSHEVTVSVDGQSYSETRNFN